MLRFCGLIGQWPVAAAPQRLGDGAACIAALVVGSCSLLCQPGHAEVRKSGAASQFLSRTKTYLVESQALSSGPTVG